MTSFSARAKATLVTGGCGEIGSNLLQKLSELGLGGELLSLDLHTPPPSEAVTGVNYIKGDITDPAIFRELEQQYDCTAVFHLAAILSTGGEHQPELAYTTNTDGTMNALSFAHACGVRRGDRPTTFLFPSTVAIYGLPASGNEDADTLKERIGAVSEDTYLEPITMYGVNKLAGEHLGRYFSRHYRLLSKTREASAVDFRSIRLPGVLSANTVPTGGTSDYAPEMIHAAAQGKMYECFARPRTTIPFLAMPDAVKALLTLSRAPRENLSRIVYNVSSFSVSAQEIATEVKRLFPSSAIVFKADVQRNRILQSWPAAMCDAAARADWGWSPDLDFRATFEDYLLPGVVARYGVASESERAPLQAVI